MWIIESSAGITQPMRLMRCDAQGQVPEIPNVLNPVELRGGPKQVIQVAIRRARTEPSKIAFEVQKRLFKQRFAN
jgi:hypothetical protein